MATLRPINLDTDLDRIAELTSLVDNEATSAELVREYETRAAVGQSRRRIVAEEDGHIAGFALATGRASNPGVFMLSLIVEPGRRRRGIGGRLLSDTLEWCRGQGGRMLHGSVRDDDPGSLRFAEAQGFSRTDHSYESVLDLDQFDESAFAGTIERLEAAGIRFFSMADVGNTAEAKWKLYELNRRTGADVPGEDPFPSFEEFNRNVFEGSWYRADGQILAADGDDWIGLGAVWYSEPTRSMYNAFTGVERAYRGRGIALALKLLGIRTARRYGAAYIRTHNHSTNAPMLAINRRLGYRPEPGLYGVERALD
jgi:GNAT superfamily N-acetyltransferase